ncbi:unnamed protein product [Rotaria magnacalcarata]|uniref:rhomboid protease n=2 Tax=Rotaria magnacalcarata TaxID=392030 RepID=A0A815JI97_9BILA|nr:unnamed protein product [Rotaria magnacalcarata]
MTWLKKMFVDENRRKSDTHFPFFILCISIIDVALLIYTIVNNNGIAPMSENPMAGASSLTLIRNGAKFVPCMKSTQNNFVSYTVNCTSISSITNTTCTYEQYLWYVCNVKNLKGFPYQAYRFFVPIFLHGGIIHLILNLFGQLCLGTEFERKFGSIRVFIIYILSGIGGVLLSAVGLPTYPGVGASGALMGIIAVHIIDIIRCWNDLPNHWTEIIMNGISALVSLIIGIFVPMIDYMAHLGGFIVGILSGLLLCPNLYWQIRDDWTAVKSRLIIMIISSVLLLAFFLGGFIGFFQTTAPVVYIAN